MDILLSLEYNSGKPKCQNIFIGQVWADGGKSLILFELSNVKKIWLFCKYGG
jgi:hypothetical protein